MISAQQSWCHLLFFFCLTKLICGFGECSFRSQMKFGAFPDRRRKKTPKINSAVLFSFNLRCLSSRQCYLRSSTRGRTTEEPFSGSHPPFNWEFSRKHHFSWLFSAPCHRHTSGRLSARLSPRSNQFPFCACPCTARKLCGPRGPAAI